MQFLYEILNPEKGEALAEVKKAHVEQLPIPVVDWNDKKQRKVHDHLVSLVDQMLTAQTKLQEAMSDSDQKLAQQRVSILDRQIDTLVYELYDLTDEEIGVVERT